MVLALRRPLTSSSATHALRGAVHSNGAGFCQHFSRSTLYQGQSKRHATQEVGKEQHLEPEAKSSLRRKFSALDEDGRLVNGATERNGPDTRKAHSTLPNAPKVANIKGAGPSRSKVWPELKMQVTHHDRSGNFSSEVQLPIDATRNNDSWRDHLVTIEHYQYESDIEAPAFQGPRLVDDPSHTSDWQLWLELILFRKRHHGAEGIIALCKEVFRKGLRLPTQGGVANQLWGLLMRAGFYDSRFLEEILTYAMHLKHSTTGSWSGLYYGFVSIALKTDPDSAYDWHLKLKNDFPPSLGDYKRIFKLSLDWGSCTHFRVLYKDTPMTGMYRTVIWLLCQSQRYPEAFEWHDILYGARDFPARFTDIKPLLDHLAYTGDAIRLERIVRELAETEIPTLNQTENFIRRREKTFSREIINRQLAEVHGVSPKHLSDSFCARLFATRMFSVETVISGLMMMATESIGPLSLREIAVRDNCDPGAICSHIDGLRNAGISLGDSVFCTIVRRMALENRREILKSIVDCDLHPDEFADSDLQGRLLAQYFEKYEMLEIERTLAILTVNCLTEDLQKVRMNLILRCQVTLGRTEKVLAILGEMKQIGIPVSAKSSRHMRVLWLSNRQVGRGAGETQELTILIQASWMTMQTGGFVPIIAWREILRRLGMAGRLLEFENLALWLVDWYSSPAKAAFPERILLAGHGTHPLIEGHASRRGPPHPLNTLFTIAALHAIVAWGFQHIFSRPRVITEFRRVREAEDPPSFHSILWFRWKWGLLLLYKLRKRGVPIQKREVARICRHRLNTLFGEGNSNRKINRRARSARSVLTLYSESMYIREMKAIWGRDLFGCRYVNLGNGIHTVKSNRSFKIP